MKELVEKLSQKGLTISSCESLTGGLFASSIVDVSGASKVLVGAYVTYMDEAKSILLNGQEVLDSVGAISSEMAQLMAKTVKDKFKSNIAISFTGNAGPSLAEGKEAGLVYSCLIINDKQYDFKDVYEGNRQDVRKHAVLDAKQRILKNI